MLPSRSLNPCGKPATHSEKELTIPRKGCFLASSADTQGRPQGVRLFFDRVLAVQRDDGLT
jgi:hypothetical protein